MYSLFGQVTVLITSIAPGYPGLKVDMLNDLAELDPQPLVAITDTVPVVNPAGNLNETVFVFCPVILVAPVGNVHV